jgi:antitoxin (DNA-binding transcriptional repressor) of toxin-antitoxin stability system
MAYTVQQAKTQLDQLLQEAEEGKTVVIARDAKPAVQLVLVGQPAPRKPRVPGKYAGLCQYSDEIFKPLETDEELREFGFDILVDAKLVDADKPNERVA